MRIEKVVATAATVAVAVGGVATPPSPAQAAQLHIWQRCSIKRQHYYKNHGYVCARPSKHSDYRLYAEPPPSTGGGGSSSSSGGSSSGGSSGGGPTPSKGGSGSRGY